MLLKSNLNEGSIANDAQNVTFRCTIRGTGTILSWISDDYIGLGGVVLQFASIDSPGLIVSSSENPNTTATLINATTNANTGVTQIVSELHITASVQYPTSAVSCRINSHGRANITTFRTVLSKELHAYGTWMYC